MSQELAQTTEETSGADESLLASFGINWQSFAFQLVNFAIVVAIVWFLILKPLTKKMEERKKLIDDSLDKAKEVESALIMSQQKYQERVDEAKIEANKIVEASHKDGEQLVEVLKEKARKDIELIITQAKRNIEIERVEMRDDIRKETADMIVTALQKILGEKLSKEIDAEYIKKVLSQKI